MESLKDLILYNPLLGTELESYGIDLPLRDDRSHQLFGLLKREFPELLAFSIDQLIAVTREDLAAVHDKVFLERWFQDESFLNEILKTYDCQKNYSYKENKSKPLSGLRESILLQVSATFTAMIQAKKTGFCFYLGGGMHHARKSEGSGFCPVNDIVIAARKYQKEYAGKVLVIDTDAHQGDGTAHITYKDTSIKTLSIHMAQAWPVGSGLDLIPCDIDIAISRGEEGSYLEQLQKGLHRLDNESFIAAIVVAGVDVHKDDELKSTEDLKLDDAQVLARDLLVYKWLKMKGIPQTWLMAGGYGDKAPAIYAQFILKLLHLMG